MLVSVTVPICSYLPCAHLEQRAQQLLALPRVAHARPPPRVRRAAPALLLLELRGLPRGLQLADLEGGRKVGGKVGGRWEEGGGKVGGRWVEGGWKVAPAFPPHPPVRCAPPTPPTASPAAPPCAPAPQSRPPRPLPGCRCCCPRPPARARPPAMIHPCTVQELVIWGHLRASEVTPGRVADNRHVAPAAYARGLWSRAMDFSWGSRSAAGYVDMGRTQRKKPRLRRVSGQCFSLHNFELIFHGRMVLLTALTVDLPLTVDRQKQVIRKLLTSSIWRACQTKNPLNESKYSRNTATGRIRPDRKLVKALVKA
jgi:hypothetical protein